MAVTTVPLQPISKGILPKLWIGIALLLIVAGAFAWVSTAKAGAQYGTAEQFFAYNAGQSGVSTTESGLQYKVIEEGEGPNPGPNDFALINYEGLFRDGESFDSGDSIPFALGDPLPGVNAISPVLGFKEALGLMNTGAKYRFWIPPELAYGDNPPPDSGIQPGDVIVFDIEMLEFISRDQLMMGMMQMQQQQMGAPPPPGGAQ